MKVVHFAGGSRIDVVERPVPDPDADHVVVKVMASAICGTERHAYEAGMSQVASAAGVLNGGHEATGIVWRTAPGSRLQEGDRVNLFSTAAHCGRCRHCQSGRWVLCRGEPPAPGFGYHAQYVRRRHDFCLPLADDIDFETGSLFGDVLGTAYRAIQRLGLKSGETLLVVGVGPIGLAAALLARFFGLTVLAADRNEERLKLARESGAVHVFNTERDDVVSRVQALVDAEGVDAAIDCAGAQATRLLCLRSVRRGGRVALVGLRDGLTLELADFREHFFRKDLDLISSWYSNPSDMAELEDLVRRGLDPLRMVSHVLPIDRAAEGFDKMFSGRSGKVILNPWDEDD